MKVDEGFDSFALAEVIAERDYVASGASDFVIASEPVQQKLASGVGCSRVWIISRAPFGDSLPQILSDKDFRRSAAIDDLGLTAGCVRADAVTVRQI
jgi:hypothetical protein